MRVVGFLLLVSGWGLVLAALAMLAAPGPRGVFALAGVAVQILGSVMTIRAHLPRRPRPRSRELDEREMNADDGAPGRAGVVR